MHADDSMIMYNIITTKIITRDILEMAKVNKINGFYVRTTVRATVVDWFCLKYGNVDDSFELVRKSEIPQAVGINILI